MRHPWANVALLVLLIGQLITGFFGFINGLAANRWLLWLHSIGAYAIVFLLLWKGSIILGVYQRGTGLNGRRLAFALLLLLLLATLFSGLLWTFDGPKYLFGFTLVTIHIFLAVPLILLLAWHAWHFRWIWRVPRAAGRRAFLRLAGTGLAGLLLWQSAGRSKELLQLPGARRRFTGSYETGSLTGRFPQVSWIADHPPPVDLARWQLVVGGAVERPLVLTYEQLMELVDREVTAVLDCTGGWYSEQIWRGVPVARLLELAGVKESARSVTFEAVSGYRRRFWLAEAQGYLLATAVGGKPLSHGHGFPARLVASGQRGVNWVKWVGRMWVNDSGKHWQLPLPLQ
ncbi:MAG: molybdopterin-dependent oxidoreductase [Chloroflexi bacterium]|nr:molybdopterin-dependent oxidoreductase [Chloroflexota bacterium]MCI0574873.1 molybdopterin-dependent oxidoreductase [Chloroflexota bacterium]MCI0650097.1 molybdopterin-dependent oxidoreductase [Chloroflexota bacterium]MCI0731181.1 molybdopterin-dependent oxidoreductase [Chloroflexota bacterium]